jgi:putative hydrolase of the HAD superfamily
MPKAVLFDLDDTIIDDSSAVDQCWRDACDVHRAEYNSIDPDVLYAAVRRNGDWFWSDPERHRVGRLDLHAARAHVVGLALSELGIERPELAHRIADQYSRHRDAAMRPLPEAIETVRWFREQGARLALITNGAGEAQRRKINQFDLAGLFDCILVEGEAGFGKPDARVYRGVLDQLGVEPADAWMVGDHLEFDVAAPQRLGIAGVWIDVQGAGLPAGSEVRPDLVIRRLSELRSVNIFAHATE